MNKRIIGIGLAAALLMIGLAAILSLNNSYEFNGGLIDPPMEAAQIQLPDSNGEMFTLSDHRGEIVLLFFGYTSCPDVCPSSLSDMKRVMNELGEDAEYVQVVFVTVDPQRDTVEKMHDYLSLFNPDFLGLTTDEEEMQKVWDAYGVYREIDTSSKTDAGYLVNHSSRIYLIDREGLMRLTYPFGTPTDEIAEDIQYLLKN